MRVLVILTDKPEALSIAAGECGVVYRSMHPGPLEAVLALLERCTADEIRTIEQGHLRRIKQRVAGVKLPEAKPIGPRRLAAAPL